MRVLFVGCVLAGCGRVGFVDLADDANGSRPDGSSDASEGPCAIRQTPPDSLTIAGETFTYTGFNNTTAPVTDALIKVYIGQTPDELAFTHSDANGRYAITVPTEGVARLVSIKYMPDGYWNTQILSDRPLDRDVSGPNMDYWRYGDGPLWIDAQQDAVYNAAGVTRNPALGTINIAIRTCDDNIIEGVTIELDPPPEALGYIDAGGVPSTSLTSTVGPYTSAVGFNAPIVETRLRASAPGLVFADFVFTVSPGPTITYPVIHPAN